MKNESNSGNATKVIRKSCNFMLYAALLSTLLFASAAQAQSCHWSQSYTRWAWTCQTNNTGYVQVFFNGAWQFQESYTVTDKWFQVYHYGPNVWTYENRLTGQVWVLIQGQWITYETYNATKALAALTALLNSQPQTGGTAPTFTIVPYDFRGDYCRSATYWRQIYANLPIPQVLDPDHLCGQ